MSRKLRNYFAAGVRLVWYIDHRSRTATVYTAIDQSLRSPRMTRSLVATCLRAFSCH